MIAAIKKFAINQLEPRFYGALWFTGGCILIAIFSLAIMNRGGFKDEIIFLGALLAIVLTTIGWIWSGRMTILMVRKTNALSLLERLSSSDVSTLKAVVYPYINDYNEYQKTDCGNRPAMPEREIEQLLSVYEQAAVAIVYGAVNHDMIKQAQILVFKRIYLGLRHHIDKTQESDSTYYEYFERLTCTWHPDLQKKTAKFAVDGSLFSPLSGSDA